MSAQTAEANNWFQPTVTLEQPIDSEMPIAAVPEPEVVYGPQLPQFSYIAGYVTIGKKVVPQYEQMAYRDALLVSQIRHEHPGTKQLFPGNLLKVLRGEVSVVLCNTNLDGTHQLGARTTLYRSTFLAD